jgi:hypothetical protein
VLTATVLLGAAVVGCKSQPPPELGQARMIVNQASSSANVQRFAQGDLQLAQNKLRDAENAAHQGKTDESRRLAQSASVDADVAVARGNAGEAQRAAKDLQHSNELLRSESQHGVVPQQTPSGAPPGTGTPPGAGPQPGTAPPVSNDSGTSR